MVDLTSKIAASTEAARRQMGREVWGGGGGGKGTLSVHAQTYALRRRSPVAHDLFFWWGEVGGRDT